MDPFVMIYGSYANKNVRNDTPADIDVVYGGMTEKEEPKLNCKQEVFQSPNHQSIFKTTKLETIIIEADDKFKKIGDDAVLKIDWY